MKEINEMAGYCLNCPVKPCSKKGCPLGNNIPAFIKEVKEENYKKAYEILSETTVLSAVCGRICPHTKQCEGSCVRGIKGNPVNIGELERIVGDVAIKEKYKISSEKNEKNNMKIAIIGSGPAGLTAAGFLLKNGYDVTIYEKHDYLGGLLVHGIPEFRLPKKIVKETIDKILDLGLKVEYNKELGKNLEIDELCKEYDAIFIAIGANISTQMGVEGENLEGVFGGNELLEKGIHPNYKGKKVAVIGGGNVAMDCARTIQKLGAESVKVIYRRAEEQMPAEKKEIESAKQEGIEFLFQNNIVKIIGNKHVEKVELIKTELVEKEGESRKVPVNIKDSNYLLDIDYIVMALGSKTEKEIVDELNLKLNQWGYIEINESKQTSNPKIFAGGDVAGEKSTVAYAARSGRDAAYAIIKYLETKKVVN